MAVTMRCAGRRSVWLQLHVGFEVGYVIGRARETRQRVMLVYDAARRHAVSRLITGNCDDAGTTFAYDSLEDLVSFIDRQFGPSAAV